MAEEVAAATAATLATCATEFRAEWYMAAVAATTFGFGLEPLPPV